MKKLTTLTATAALTLTLGGCFSGNDGAPPSATDPRDGRVTITWSNCRQLDAIARDLLDMAAHLPAETRNP